VMCLTGFAAPSLGQPSAWIMDSGSTKTVSVGGVRGYDGDKNITGPK
jgi:hypothetical protein